MTPSRCAGSSNPIARCRRLTLVPPAICSKRSSRDLAQLGHAFAIAGKHKDALKLLQELKELSKKEYVSPFSFALVFAGLGNKSQALAWLEKAYKGRDGAVPFLKVNPKLAPLHSYYHFQDLVRRMNFPA